MNVLDVYHIFKMTAKEFLKSRGIRGDLPCHEVELLMTQYAIRHTVDRLRSLHKDMVGADYPNEILVADYLFLEKQLDKLSK